MNKMKKLIVMLLAVVMSLSLVACGGSNIEKFCGGYDIVWDGYEGQHNDSVRFYALFENGTLTIEKREKDGSQWPVKETKEYSYELEGKNKVIIDGETYTYEITDDRVKFDKDLMGIVKYWKR